MNPARGPIFPLETTSGAQTVAGINIFLTRKYFFRPDFSEEKIFLGNFRAPKFGSAGRPRTGDPRRPGSLPAVEPGLRTGFCLAFVEQARPEAGLHRSVRPKKKAAAKFAAALKVGSAWPSLRRSGGR